MSFYRAITKISWKEYVIIEKVFKQFGAKKCAFNQKDTVTFTGKQNEEESGLG